MEKNLQTIELDWGYDDLHKVTRLISSSRDVKSACEILARHLKHLDLSLLSVFFCDLEGEQVSVHPYRDLPDSLRSLSKQFRQLGGCPNLREAKRLRKPFDALQVDRKKYPEFLEQRFLDELAKLGHLHVLVMPIALGRGLANIVVGTGARSISVGLQAELFSSIGQCFGAVITRFPEITKLFAPKILSAVQAKILFLLSIGMSRAEITRLLDLGDYAFGALLKDAQNRLHANSLPHAVAKALAVGEFSNMNMGEPDAIRTKESG